MFKSATTIRSEAIARILGVRSDFSILDGEPQVDIIDTMSIELAKLYFFADYVERLTAISGLLLILSDDTYKATLAVALGVSATTLTLGTTLGVPADLGNDVEAILYTDINRIASDYGLTRKGAEASVGTVRFYCDSAAPVTIPLGTRLYVRGTTNLSYSTTTPVTAVVPTPDPTGTGYYCMNVSVRCDNTGAGGNALANTIQSLSVAITHVVRVTNLGATTGGKPRETNIDLINRILAQADAICIDTRQGYEVWAKAKTGIVDANCQGSGDPLMVRAPAGAVDLWIMGIAPVSVTVTTKILNAGELFVLPFQPILSISTVANGTTPLTDGNGYVSYLDTDGGYAYSARAYGYIQFQVGETGYPVTGDVVNVTYVYDDSVRALQEMLDTDPTLHVQSSDVLVKTAIRWYDIVEMHVVPLPGYTQSQAESAVVSALTAFFAAKRMGDSIEWSDLVVAVATATLSGTAVVDRIEGPVMGRSAEANPSPLPTLSDSDLAAAANEYYALGEIIFV